MSNVKVRTYHAKQGLKLPTVIGTDQIVIAQPDPTGANGFRTVNINLDESYALIRDTLKKTPNLIALDVGLKGTGVAGDPIRVDESFIKSNWVNRKFINFAQVGTNPGRELIMTTGPNIIVPPTPVFLAGISKQMEGFSLDLRTKAPANHHGKSVWMYLVAVNGDLEYEYTTEPRAERYDSAFIGMFTFGATTSSLVNTIAFRFSQQFIRFGNYRISQQAAGVGVINAETIPTSQGVVYEVNYTGWGSIAGSSFKINNVTPGMGEYQSAFEGKYSDTVVVNGIEVRVVRMFGGITMTDGVVIKSSLVMEAVGNDTLPKTLEMTITDTAIVNPPPKWVVKFDRVDITSSRAIYVPIDQANSDVLTSCLAKGYASQSTIRGSFAPST